MQSTANSKTHHRSVKNTDMGYLYFSLWSFLMVLAGFWPGYWSRLNNSRTEIPLIIHLHAFIFSGWLLLFFIQAYLIRKGKVKQHQKLGGLVRFYVILMLAIGALTAVVRWRHYLSIGNEEDALLTLVAGFRDLLFFGLFFALAMHHRKTPDLHKIWMLGASAYLLIAAVARLSGYFFHGSNLAFYLLWLMPILWFLVKAMYEKRPCLKHHLYLLALMILGAILLQPMVLLLR